MKKGLRSRSFLPFSDSFGLVLCKCKDNDFRRITVLKYEKTISSNSIFPVFDSGVTQNC